MNTLRRARFGDAHVTLGPRVLAPDRVLLVAEEPLVALQVTPTHVLTLGVSGALTATDRASGERVAAWQLPRPGQSPAIYPGRRALYVGWVEPGGIVALHQALPGGSAALRARVVTGDADVSTWALASDGSRLLTACDDHVALWSPSDARPLAKRRFGSHEPEVQGVFAVGDDLFRIRWYHVAMDLYPTTEDTFVQAADLAEVPPRDPGPFLAGTPWEGAVLHLSGPTLAIRDVRTNFERARLVDDGAGEVRAAVVDEIGPEVFSAHADGAVRAWRLDPIAVDPPLPHHGWPVRRVSALGDVVISQDTSTALLWRLDDGSFVGKLGEPAPLVRGPDDDTWIGLGWTTDTWSLRTGKPRKASLGQGNSAGLGPVYAPDGSRALTVTEYVALTLWDVASGAKLVTLDPELSQMCIAPLFDPAGGRVVVPYLADGTLHVFDARTGRRLRTLPSHTFGTRGILWRDPGRTLLSVGWCDGRARVVDLDGHVAAEVSFADGEDNVAQAFTPLADGTVVIATKRRVVVVDHASGAVRTVGRVAEGETEASVVVGGERVTLRWDPSDPFGDVGVGRRERQRGFLPAGEREVWVDHDGRTALSWGTACRVELWAVPAGERLASVPTRELPGRAGVVAAALDGSIGVVAATGPARLVVVDLAAGTVRGVGPVRARTTALVARGGRAMCAYDDGSAELVDLATGDVLRLPDPSGAAKPPWAVGTWAVAMATADGGVALVRVDTGEVHASDAAPREPARLVACDALGTRVITVHGASEIMRWGRNGLRPSIVGTWVFPVEVTAVGLAPDGRLIVGDARGEVTLVDG